MSAGCNSYISFCIVILWRIGERCSNHVHRVKESAHLLPHVTHDVAHALASNQLQSVHLRGDVVGVWSTMNTASIIEHAQDYLHLHPIDRLESERAAAVMLNERGSFGLVHLGIHTQTDIGRRELLFV